MATSRLDDALDRLFSVPVDEFMQTRDALVGELRAAGDKEAAAAVKAKAKPTLAAHALNQLARSARAELDMLFAAGTELASGKDFKAALERQRAALDKVRAKVTGADAVDIVNVLRGAMVDEALAVRVKVGQFSRLPEVQVGFFGVAPEGGVVAAPKKKASSDAKNAKKEAAPDIDRGELDRARAARVEREKAAREKAEREKAERAARIARDLEEAEADLAKLNAAVADAERKADHARRQAKVAADRVQAIKDRISAD